MSINTSGLGLGFNQYQNIYNTQSQQGYQQGPPPPPMYLNGQNGGGFFNQRFDNAQGIGFQGLNFGGQNQFRFPGGPGQQGFGLFQGQGGQQGFGLFQGQGQQGQLPPPPPMGGPGGFGGQGGFGGPGGLNGQRPDPAQMFAKIDANSDGTVTQEEFNNLPAPPNGRGPTAEMKAERWAQIDSNSDGSATKEEFLQAGPPPRIQRFENFGGNINGLQGSNGIDIQSLFSNLLSTFQAQTA